MDNWCYSKALFFIQINQHISRPTLFSFKFILFLSWFGSRGLIYCFLSNNPVESIWINYHYQEHQAGPKEKLSRLKNEPGNSLLRLQNFSSLEGPSLCNGDAGDSQGCLNTERFFSLTISIFIDVWRMTVLCTSARIHRSWWILQRKGLFLVETQSSACIKPPSTCL